MAIGNGKFKGSIGGKSVWDYNIEYKGDCNKSMSIRELEFELYKRKEHLLEVLNIDPETGWSMDEFWMEVWDMACCKSNINTSDTTWTDTNIAKKLESFGTYLIMPYQVILNKIEEKKLNDEDKEFQWRYYRAKEVELDDEIINDADIINDKNYRLAPKDTVDGDFVHRKAYSKDYNYYKDVIYKKNDEELKAKIRKDLINRYGHCDELFEYTPYELKDYDTWSKIKKCEMKKINLLREAKNNLNILKDQHAHVVSGKPLLFHEDLYRKVNKYEEENRLIKLSKQLQRLGLDNSKILEIEKDVYTKIDKKVNVNLSHIMNNISDVNDYMMQVKLAYTNRVFINPTKCPNIKHAEDIVDYTDVNHVKALMYLPENHAIDPFNYMSPMAYDITEMIERLHRNGILSDRDLEIIEGFRFGVSQEQLSEELGLTQPTVHQLFNRIARNITQGFIEDEEDLLYLNVLKGEYKKCSKCENIKIIQRFDIKRSNKDGYKNICKKCQ